MKVVLASELTLHPGYNSDKASAFPAFPPPVKPCKILQKVFQGLPWLKSSKGTTNDAGPGSRGRWGLERAQNWGYFGIQPE